MINKSRAKDYFTYILVLFLSVTCLFSWKDSGRDRFFSRIEKTTSNAAIYSVNDIEIEPARLPANETDLTKQQNGGHLFSVSLTIVSAVLIMLSRDMVCNVLFGGSLILNRKEDFRIVFIHNKDGSK